MSLHVGKIGFDGYTSIGLSVVTLAAVIAWGVHQTRVGAVTWNWARIRLSFKQAAQGSLIGLCAGIFVAVLMGILAGLGWLVVAGLKLCGVLA